MSPISISTIQESVPVPHNKIFSLFILKFGNHTELLKPISVLSYTMWTSLIPSGTENNIFRLWTKPDWPYPFFGLFWVSPSYVISQLGHELEDRGSVL